jgi:hypothetical protein
MAQPADAASRERSSHREAAEIAWPRLDEELDGPADALVANRFVRGKRAAHAGSSGAVSIRTSLVVISFETGQRATAA